MAAACATAAAGTAAAAAGDDHPRIFVYDDGRHASPLYQFAPPLTPDDIVFTVDQFAGSGADTVIVSAGLEGGPVHYATKHGQLWGANVEKWEHLIFYRASRNLHQLVADGHNPMQLMCDRAHQASMFCIPTLPLCIVGQPDLRSMRGLGRTSDFAYEARYHVGPEDDRAGPQPVLLTRMFKEERLDFMLPAVRAERFALFSELLADNPTDGVEVDLSLNNEFGPLTKLSRCQAELPAVLTGWLRELRAVADDAQRRQGRRKLLYVRFPAAAEETWELLGLDVRAWVSEQLVDGLVVITTVKKQTPEDPLVGNDQSPHLAPIIALCAGTSCRVLAGYTTIMTRPQASDATPPMIHAAALNCYAAGSDGFGIATGMWAPNGWPLTATEYATLRTISRPEVLATSHKIYRAWALNTGGDADAETLLPPPPNALPGERPPQPRAVESFRRPLLYFTRDYPYKI
jgi:hypothetical protein